MIETPSHKVPCRIWHLKCKVRIEALVRPNRNGDLCYLLAVLSLVIVDDSVAGGIGRLIARQDQTSLQGEHNESKH
jgi:hypothetical protein